ncbi:probable DNA primase large subunit [Anoplophora glabripennis]|uniref:probable DNA primase large subunit n=1 Tax=Anoplophora glabripennis TaxID=217634 RepID=UPI000873D173|nr:probable DNA primase large subunit [Anoplophora glabripennis]
MDDYKLNLTTYTTPPSECCSLPELQQICEERLQLYKIMDEAKNLGYKPSTAVWNEYLESQIVQRKLSTSIILLRNENYSVGHNKARRHNHIAHWMLSLCYCRTKDLRVFFTRCELQWFEMLYKRMKDEELQQFFTDSELECVVVSQREKNLLKEQLLMCTKVKEIDFDTTIFYKINFSEIPTLLPSRKVFLCKGLAYFPQNYLIYHIHNKLWRLLSGRLFWLNKVLPTGIKEDRIEYFLNNLPLISPNYKRFSDKNIIVDLENIDQVAAAHYPLCMKTIHSLLRNEHHLKYDCKMQYGIFLKWIGLSYQDAMEFWKDEFTKKMSSEWFDRKYSYLFKHQYGKVGGMIDYEPSSCEEIQNSCPGPGQHHGCPFKHWDLDRLLQRCRSDGFSTYNIKNVRDLVISKKYEEACMMYFRATHNATVENVFKSPNQYFVESYEFEESLNDCLVDVFVECCDP